MEFEDNASLTSLAEQPMSRRSLIAATVGLGASLMLGSCASNAASSGAVQQGNDSSNAADATSTAGSTSATSASATAASQRAELKWWQDTIVYEAYPKSFLDTAGTGTGTIDGITEKVDYLAALGVGALWLTPVYRSPMKDNGYDISDYYDIDPSFGTMDDMERLIDEAGRRGIRIVMDLVMNHTSNENAWFLESKSSRDNDKADWYIWRDAAEGGGAPTNWRSIFGGPAWTWCEERQQYYLHTFGDFQPDLNWECDALRNELFDMARFWLEKGVGGFRLDAIPYIKKPAFVDGAPDASDGMISIHTATVNTPGILDFLREFKREVMKDTDAFTVGEANGVAPSELPAWVGADGVFDMIFEFNHMLVPLGGKEDWYDSVNWKLTDLKQAFASCQKATAENGWYPIYLENHDQPRSVSHFLPNATDEVAAAKLLGCVLMTMRGTPFVYQGEELGYTNVAWPSIEDYDDVSSHNQYTMTLEAGKTEAEALECVQKYSRDNARTPMQWDASANAGFTTGKPWLPVHDDYKTCNVEAQADDPNSVLAHFRKLAELRQATPVLAAGDWRELEAESEQIFAFERTCADERAVVLANFTEDEVKFDPSLVQGLELAFSTHGRSAAETLRPLEAVVYVNA